MVPPLFKKSNCLRQQNLVYIFLNDIKMLILINKVHIIGLA